MAIHQLIDLDFSPGIKAQYINLNFQLLYNWLKRERLRLGGWGIVEGFDLLYNPNDFTVTVSEGVLINQEGDEVTVPSHTFSAGDINYRRISATYEVNEEGKIVLDDYVYLTEQHKTLTYNPPNTIQTFDDETLKVTDADGFVVPVVRVLGKSLWVNERYKDKTLIVEQTVYEDRTDTIMLHKDGTYEYLWSIDSPSPSHVDLADYEETFCIAVLYWQVTDEGTTCDFFTNHRSYRKIYVDKTNTLYINGEVYKKQKFIYFVEPEEKNREENDLWYNTKDNTLYIWRQTDDEWDWIAVNDHSEIVVKERRFWRPEDNPEDLKTFMFDDEEVNLHYIPGTNALDIIINNVPLMDDQYKEITVATREKSDVQDQIDDLQLKIKTQQLELELMYMDRNNLNREIQVLRKDLKDSKTLYPKAYDPDNDDYTISNSDINNLRNLMVIDQRVTKTLEELAVLLQQIKTKEDLIISYQEQLLVTQKILSGEYIEKGIGFMLKHPLSHNAYVEVTVTHQVKMKPAREIFQRCSVFVRENDITVTEDGTNQVFRTESSYVLGEEQLEIFVDGVKLSKQINEFCELIDAEKEEKFAELVDYNPNNEQMKDLYSGTSSNHFKIKMPLSIGNNVTYRISKQVWNYDQLDAVVSNIKDYAKQAFNKAVVALNTATELQGNIFDILDDIRNEILIVKAEVAQREQYYVKGNTIDYTDIPLQVKSALMGVPINQVKPAVSLNVVFDHITVIKDQNGVITGGDIFDIFYVTSDISRILVKEGTNRNIQDIDYWITPNDNSITITLRDDLISADAVLYLTGFKRGVS